MEERMEERRVLAKIPLPTGLVVLATLGDVLPSDTMVEGHGDELWIVASCPDEPMRRLLKALESLRMERRPEESE